MTGSESQKSRRRLKKEVKLEIEEPVVSSVELRRRRRMERGKDIERRIVERERSGAE